MKSPRVKPHLIESPIPLVSYATVTSECGVMIERATFPMIWDTEAMGEEVSVSRNQVCPSCWDLLFWNPERPETENQSYIYALLPEKEADKHPQFQEAA